MKKLFALMLVLLVGLVFAAGCGDDDDDDKDTSPTGGGSTAGSLATHSGANAKVTAENVEAVSEEISAKSWEIFGRAMQTISYKPADYVQNLSGDVNGNNSGKASVSGKITTKMSGQTPSTMDYNFNCTLYDFSDDGKLFLGGKLAYTGNYNYTTQVYTIKVVGDVKFNGQYDGSQKYTLTVEMNPMSGTSKYTYNTTTTSGGQTFTNSFTF